MWNRPVRSEECVSPAVLRLPSMESSSVPSRRWLARGRRDLRPGLCYDAGTRELGTVWELVCIQPLKGVTSVVHPHLGCHLEMGFQAQTVGSQDVVSYQHDGSCHRMMSSPSKKAIVQVDKPIPKQSIVTSRQLIHPLTTTWRATTRSKMLQVASHSTRLTAAEK